jgi:hypothetical protein
MGRSPGFGSTAYDYAPFQTRFRSGSGPEALNLAVNGNSPAHSSIGTLSARACAHGPRTACRRTVSGTISLPLRGAFHRSLAVLSAIGRFGSLALEGGPPRFPRGSSAPAVLGWSCHRSAVPFAYGALTLYGRPFQVAQLGPTLPTAGLPPRPQNSHNPHLASPAGYTTRSVWTLPRSLATTWGISFDFLPSRY